MGACHNITSLIIIRIVKTWWEKLEGKNTKSFSLPVIQIQWFGLIVVGQVRKYSYRRYN